MELFIDYHILYFSSFHSLVPQEADMAIVGSGEEGYFVPPTKGTSPAQVGVEQFVGTRFSVLTVRVEALVGYPLCVCDVFPLQ